jgi:hypothetical protein
MICFDSCNDGIVLLHLPDLFSIKNAESDFGISIEPLAKMIKTMLQGDGERILCNEEPMSEPKIVHLFHSIATNLPLNENVKYTVEFWMKPTIHPQGGAYYGFSFAGTQADDLQGVLFTQNQVTSFCGKQYAAYETDLLNGGNFANRRNVNRNYPGYCDGDGYTRYAIEINGTKITVYIGDERLEYIADLTRPRENDGVSLGTCGFSSSTLNLGFFVQTGNANLSFGSEIASVKNITVYSGNIAGLSSTLTFVGVHGEVLSQKSVKQGTVISEFPVLEASEPHFVKWFYQNTNVVIIPPYTVTHDAVVVAREIDTSDFEKTICRYERSICDESQNHLYLAQREMVYFSIVYPEDLDSELKHLLSELSATLKKCSCEGFSKMYTSNLVRYDSDQYEILIGDTGYPESKQTMDALNYGDWTIRFCGKKLVVTGFSKNAMTGYNKSVLNEAISRLIFEINNIATEDGTIAFPSDWNITVSSLAILNELPRFDGTGYPLIADEGQNTGLVVMKGATIDDYHAYLNKLTDVGYRLYTSHAIGENLFSTYENGIYVIHTGFYDYESAVRVTIEKQINLLPLMHEKLWLKNSKVTTSLAQVGMGESAGGLMSYCYQLADGSFLVIDGGFAEHTERLYNYMKAKAPNHEIIIAAWIITQNDGDHAEVFRKFNEIYVNRVRVEQVIMNMRDAEELTLRVANAIPGCRVIKAHTGDRIDIRNAEIEMLYTPDSYLPEPYKIYNNTSLVFTVVTEGMRALFMADASDEVAKILYSMYGEYLKCGILQLPHHGLRNGHKLNMPDTVKLHELIQPEIVLLCNSNEHWLNTSIVKEQQIALFDWNLKAMSQARECYLAGSDVTVLEFPYTAFSAYKFQINQKC